MALLVQDAELRVSLTERLQAAGHVTGDDDVTAVAAVLVAEVRAGSDEAVAALRARARSGAAIVVVLAENAAARERDLAYAAGAALCVRAPIDEVDLIRAVSAAIELRAARDHVQELSHQLDLQSHLAALGRVTAGFTHEIGNPLAAIWASFEAIRESL